MGAGPILSAAPELQKMGYTVPGVIVIDVVEGEYLSVSALDYVDGDRDGR